MKKMQLYSSTNTSNIPVKPIVGAEEDVEEVEVTIEDKIKDAADDFDYILDGLNQLDAVAANIILNEIHEFLENTISDIAEQLSH